MDNEDIKQQLHMLHLALVTVTETVDGIRLVLNMVAKAVKPAETLTTIATLKALSIDPTLNIEAVRRFLACFGLVSSVA